MKIVLFTHPSFLDHQSMPRYASMLVNGMQERGHEVEVWSPKARFYRLAFMPSLKKWFAYVDQYLVFPIEVQLKFRTVTKDTLFVFADQALGPWVPLVKNRSHVVHCHDFLALKSALGQIPENPTSSTGKVYQNYIRNGFSKGKNFIAISKKTQADLHDLHLGTIAKSAVCYNGLNRTFEVLQPAASRSVLADKLKINLGEGYIMHIGGNQYYKNRKGVVELYDAWRSKSNLNLPLLLIGSEPSDELIALRLHSSFKDDIHFVSNLSDAFINHAYSGAICLLFPSLDEGFGWPIVEAMACGCPVITTNEAPMNEVGGSAALYIDKRPTIPLLLTKWQDESSDLLEEVCALDRLQRERLIGLSLSQAEKFTADYSLNAIEAIYKDINQIR